MYKEYITTSKQGFVWIRKGIEDNTAFDNSENNDVKCMLDFLLLTINYIHSVLG